MEKSADTIGERKYRKLSDRQRHKILTALAREALQNDAWTAFQQRYRVLQSWVPMDGFQPPAWLTPREALVEYQAFHARLAGLAEPVEPVGSSSTPSPAQTSWQPQHAVTLALDRVRSPYNVGSILRLVDNFGLTGVVHASSWLDMSHLQLQKSARGCQTWIPVQHQENLPDWLAHCGMPIIGLDTGAEALPLADWVPPSAMVVVVGHEADGISEAVAARCHQRIEIPMLGYKRSMNVSHALAVCLWHVTQKLGSHR